MLDSSESLRFEAQLRVSPEAASWTVFDVPDSRAFFGGRRADAGKQVAPAFPGAPH